MGGTNVGFANLANHPADCACGAHDKTPRTCPYPDCEVVRNGVRDLGVHIAWTHKRRKRGFKRVLVPDGNGWLRAVLRDPHRIGGLQLDALPKFAKYIADLADTRTYRQRKATRAVLRSHLDEIAELDAAQPWTLPLVRPTIPASLGEVMVLLSLETNVPMRFILAALLAYGIEALGKEMRVTTAAPYPRLPSSQTGG